MADVLDNERGPAPLWTVPVAILAVVAVGIALAWRTGGSTGPSAAPSPSASPSPAALPAPGRAGNACGGDVEQPLIHAAALPASTGLHILVGDRDLRLLDVDAGTAKVLATRRDGRSFVGLAQTADEVLTVLRNPCAVNGYGNGLVAAVDPADGSIKSYSDGEEVIPGEPPSILEYDPSDEATLVRGLEGGPQTRLPVGYNVYARTTDGYFMSGGGSGDGASQVGHGYVHPDGVTITRHFGAGPVVAASPELLFWLAGDCPGVHCLLTWTTPDATNTARAIDTYACCGAVSPDGTKMAFRKSRATGRLGEHPGPPNDIAILDRTHGGAPLVVLPGLVLPAKAGVTLTWSPDSVWLVIGADLGRGPAILIWRQGMDRPAQVPVPPTGGGTTGPPALLVLPR